MKLPTEAVEQAELAEFLDACGVLWVHVPNGFTFGYRKGGAEIGRYRRLLKQGFKPGAVDAHVFTPPPLFPRFRGAAVELKRQRGPKGGTAHCAEFTDDERAWLCSLDAAGWAVPFDDNSDEVVPCYGAAEAIAWFERLGYRRAVGGKVAGT